MQLPIQFQSLERIEGKEGKSKLLHSDSLLYQFLHRLKRELSKQYAHQGDRMDLHIELTKARRDPAFSAKAAALQGQLVDLANPQTWGYLGRGAFVVWTPAVADYGRTHITVCFFGEHPHPKLADLIAIAQRLLLK